LKVFKLLSCFYIQHLFGYHTSVLQINQPTFVQFKNKPHVPKNTSLSLCQSIQTKNPRPRNTEKFCFDLFLLLFVEQKRKKSESGRATVDTFSLSRPRNQNASNVVNTTEVKENKNHGTNAAEETSGVTHVTHSTEVEHQIKLEINKISLKRTNKQTKDIVS